VIAARARKELRVDMEVSIRLDVGHPQIWSKPPPHRFTTGKKSIRRWFMSHSCSSVARTVAIVVATA
jgi:hypothetical protein